MENNFFKVDDETDKKINRYLASLDKDKNNSIKLIEKFYYDEVLLENEKLKEILNNNSDGNLNDLKKESLRLIEIVNNKFKKI